MGVSKEKTMVYRVLVCLFLLNLILRLLPIPIRGGDSWAMVYRAVSITDLGYIAWLIHPLSFFGWYPYSYPSGNIVYLATVMMVTGIDISSTISVCSNINWFLGLLTMFLFARVIQDYKTALISVFFLSTFYVYFTFSWDQISSRSLFIGIFPLFLMLFLSSTTDNNRSISIFLLRLLIIIALASIHRLFLLLLILTVPPLIVAYLFKRFHISNKFVKSTHENLILSFFAILFIIQIIYDFIGADDYTSYSKLFLEPTNYLFTTINLVVDYAFFYNLSIVLIPFGFIGLIRSNMESFHSTFLLLNISICILFLRDLEYFLILFSPLAAIYAGYGMKLMRMSNTNTFFHFTALSSLILLSLVFTIYYYTVNEHILFVFSIIVTLYLLFFATSTSKLNNKELYKRLISGVLAFSLIFFAHSSYYVHERYGGWEDYGSKKDDDSMWIRYNFNNEGWITEETILKNQLGAISGSPIIDTDVYLVTNPLLLAELEATFDLSVVIAYKRSTYSWEIDKRYDPDYVSYNILTLHNEELTEKYELSYVVVRDGGSGSSDNFKLLDFVEDKRYVIYSRDTTHFYLYE